MPPNVTLATLQHTIVPPPMTAWWILHACRLFDLDYFANITQTKHMTSKDFLFDANLHIE